MSDLEEEYTSEEEEQSKEIQARWRPNYIIIALDTHQSMFVEHSPGKSSFTYSIEACSSLEDYIIFPPVTSSKCPLGIITTNYDDSDEIIAKLEDPPLDTVKKLRELKKCPNKELRDKFERKNTFDLSTFVLMCKKQFMRISGKPYKKIVVYITNDDNPIKSDAEKENVIREIETLPDVELSFNVVTLNKNFNLKHLYSALEACNSNVKVTYTPDLLMLIDKLSTYLHPPFNQQKSTFYPFKSHTDRYIDVVVKKPVKRAKFTPNFHVTKDDHQPVSKLHPVFKMVNDYSYQYSPQMPPVTFTKQEKEAIFSSDYPFGFTLLAVSRQLSEYGLIHEPCTLIEKHKDDESGIFECFWQYCKEKNKVLLCARRYKIGKRVSIVELSPVLVNNNVPVFRVTRLPTLDDLHLPEIPAGVDTDESVPLDEDKTAALDALVKRLHINCDPIGFPNVTYRKTKQYIKSQLLDVDEVAGVSDYEANDEKMDKYMRDVAEQFKSAFDMHEQQKGAKRKGKETQGKGKKK